MRYDGWKVRGITGDGIWLWLIVGVLMLNMSCSDRQPEAVSRFREGDPFPALVLTRLDGGQVSFEKFNDKYLGDMVRALPKGATQSGAFKQGARRETLHGHRIVN